jgi:hypothetical protein
MTIEIFYLTAQMQRWLNARVARHLEAQAARLKPAKGLVFLKNLGADGPGGSVGLDRSGMPAVGETGGIDDPAADACYSDARTTTRDRDAVHA